MPRKKRTTYGQGGIYPDKKTGGFIAKIPNGHGGYVVRRAATSEAAQVVYKELLGKRDAGVNFDGAAQPLTTFANTWLKDVVASRNPAKQTKIHYQQMIELYILPYHGAYRLDSIRAEHVLSMLNDLHKHVSSRTVYHVYTVYHQIMDVAEKWQYITRNPVALVNRPRAESYQAETLNAQQVTRLLLAVAGHRLEALYHCAVLLGLRKGEALGLRWTDYSAETLTIAITQQVQYERATENAPGHVVISQRTKTQQSKRVLPVTPHLADLLTVQWERLQQERHNARWQEHGLIFPSERGTPLQPRNLSRHYKATLEAAGLPSIRFHDLRHTCATLLGEFAPEHVISALLGHSSANVTRQYARATMQAMRQAVEQLEREYLDKAASDTHG